MWMWQREAENSRSPLLQGHMTWRNSLETFRLDHRQGLLSLPWSPLVFSSVSLGIVSSFPALDMVALHITDCPWINFQARVCFANLEIIFVSWTNSECVCVCPWVWICVSVRMRAWGWEHICFSGVYSPEKAKLIVQGVSGISDILEQRSAKYHLWAKFSL